MGQLTSVVWRLPETAPSREDCGPASQKLVANPCPLTLFVAMFQSSTLAFICGLLAVVAGPILARSNRQFPISIAAAYSFVRVEWTTQA